VWGAYASVGISFSSFAGKTISLYMLMQSARFVKHYQVHSMHIKWNIRFRLPLKGYNVSKLINASICSGNSSKRWKMSEGVQIQQPLFMYCYFLTQFIIIFVMDSLRNVVIHCEKQIWCPINWLSKRKYCKCMIATNFSKLTFRHRASSI